MILVLGAGGNVGRQVVHELQASGASVKGAYRGGKAPAGVTAVEADYEDEASLRRAMEGVDGVFVVSPNPALEHGAVRAAKAAGARRIVKLSVWGAADEAFAFARMHRPVEREIENSGLAWTFLRSNGFMQNVVNYMGSTIKSQGAFYQPAEDARISHIDVRDIGRVAAEVLTRPGHDGKAYDLSGPQALSYGEIAETLSRVLGRKIAYVKISDDDYKKGAIGAGIPEVYAEALVDLVRYYRTGAGSRVSPDVRQLTGRDPVPFESFARDHAGSLR